MVMKLKGGLDAAGNLTVWDYEGWQANRGGRPGNVGAANLPTGYLIGLTLPTRRPTTPSFPPLGADSSNTVAGYLQDEDGTVPNARVVSRTVDSVFFTGPLRSPARIQNTFANESFIDELAAAAKADPVAFRLRYVGDPRLRALIEVAAKAAGWQARPSPKAKAKGDVATGRGIAAMQYHDTGIIINPNGIKAQIEGNVVHGVSRALKEEVELKPNKSGSTNWDTYQVFRFMEMPEVKIALINRPNEPAMGSGENAMTAIPAAVGNAIFDATGVRLRRLPFTAARVKAALK
jgi:CO/xanthine dehydrogenase Mo-binding subunit